MSTQKEINEKKNKKKLNQKCLVTVESITDDGLFYSGRTYAQAPEIDPAILVIADKQSLEIGKEYYIKIIEATDYELIGVTI